MPLRALGLPSLHKGRAISGWHHVLPRGRCRGVVKLWTKGQQAWALVEGLHLVALNKRRLVHICRRWGGISGRRT